MAVAGLAITFMAALGPARARAAQLGTDGFDSAVWTTSNEGCNGIVQGNADGNELTLTEAGPVAPGDVLHYSYSPANLPSTGYTLADCMYVAPDAAGTYSNGSGVAVADTDVTGTPPVDPFTFTYTIPSGVSGAYLCSVAKITSGNSGGSGGNRKSLPACVALTSATPPSALSLNKSPVTASVLVGAPVAFNIDVSNNDTHAARQFQLTDTLPTVLGLAASGWNYSVVSPSPLAGAASGTVTVTCSITAGSLSCAPTGNNAKLPAGTSFRVVVTNSAGATSAGPVNNTANASGQGLTPMQSQATVTVGNPTPPPPTFIPPVVTTTTTSTTTTLPPTTTTTAPPLVCTPPAVLGPNGTCVLGETLAPVPTISKTADAATVNAGQPIGYTITVANTGNAATTVSVHDPLPQTAGLSWTIDRQPDGGPACSISSGALNCGPSSLAAGAKWSVHIVSPTTTRTCGNVDNTASLTASNVTGTKTSTARVSVVCVAPEVITPTKAPSLPFTGANSTGWGLVGMASVAAGFALVLAGRRRNEEGQEA